MSNPDTTRADQSTKSRKLHKRYTPVIFALLMAAIMSFFMCSTIVAVQAGFTPEYGWNVLKAYLLATPVAFCCVIFVRPLVARLIPLVVDI